MTNGCYLQIVNSSVKSTAVWLTWWDCKWPPHMRDHLLYPPTYQNVPSLSLILGMTFFKQPQPLFRVVSLIISHCFQPLVSNHLTDFMHGFSSIFTLCTVSLRVYKETTHIQGCALRKIEGSPVLWTCEIQCAQHMISMEKQRLSSCPRTKVSCHRPLGSARAQPWHCNLQNSSQKRSPVVSFL